MKSLILHFNIYSFYLFILSIALLSPSVLFAAEGYQPLILIPGLNENGNYSLPEYINRLYLLLIALGAIVAVIRISFAGAKYSLNDIVTSKEEAKEDIKGVLFGLLLLLIPFVVLNTIYPGLTSLDILKSAPKVDVNGNVQGNNPPNTPPSSNNNGAERSVRKSCNYTQTTRGSSYDSSSCIAECAALNGIVVYENTAKSMHICNY